MAGKGSGSFPAMYPGFVFLPSDQILLDFFLRRKVDGQADDHVFAAIPTVDLFGHDASPPWCLHPAAVLAVSFNSSSSSSSCTSGGGGGSSGILPSRVTEWFYCFARTSRRGPGACRTTSCGTWLSGGDKRVTMGSADGEESVVLGYKNCLAFKIPAGDGGNCGSKWVPTSWVMQEFKLHRDDGRGPTTGRKAATASDTKTSGSDQMGVLVLCRIRCTKPTEPKLGPTSGPSRQYLEEEEELGRPQKRLRTSNSFIVGDSASSNLKEVNVQSHVGESGQDSLVGSPPSSSPSLAAPSDDAKLSSVSTNLLLLTSPSSIPHQFLPANVGFWKTNPVEQQQVGTPAAAGGLNSAAPNDGIDDSWMRDIGIPDEDAAAIWELLVSFQQ